MNRISHFTLGAGLLFLLALPLPVAAESATPGANAVHKGSETRIYKTAGDRSLKLLIEKPAGWLATDKRPAIVFFFGGGWMAGTPEQFHKESEYLASRGMVGIRVEYRTIPKGVKEPPTLCVQDAKSAMRWVRAHAAELGVNPQRIAAAGGSAGGHLAAFVSIVDGLDAPGDDLRISPKGDALVLWNPVFNNGPGQWGHEIVGNRYKEFSPAHNITSNAPPTIVFLGTKDQLVPVATVKKFKADMEEAGVRCEAVFYDEQGHGFFNRQPWLSKTLIEADKFLTSLGWLQGEPTLQDTPVAKTGQEPRIVQTSELRNAEAEAKSGASK